MKKQSIFLFVILAIFLIFQTANAETLSLQADGNKINVVVDNSANVLGAAVTITWEAGKLNAPNVTSDYFETFQALGYPAGQNGLDSNYMVNGYSSPLVDNAITGGISIAGARPDAGTGNILFVLDFTGKATGLCTGTVQVEMNATEGPSAGGYSAGEFVTPLVGKTGDTYDTLVAATALNSTPPISFDCPSAATEVQLTLTNGWNMFSLPVNPVDKKVSSLFSGANVTVYSFNQSIGYTILSDTSELQPGEGYWVLLDEADRVFTFSGDAIGQYSKTISNGWYMVGGVSAIATPTVNPSTGATFYKFSSSVGYSIETQLEPGVGYWFYTPGPGDVLLQVQEP